MPFPAIRLAEFVDATPLASLASSYNGDPRSYPKLMVVGKNLKIRQPRLMGTTEQAKLISSDSADVQPEYFTTQSKGENGEIGHLQKICCE
jgi:hypothetical protein